MPVPQDSFFVVEEQARCLLHKTVFLLWKNRQDACATKFFCCGRTGKMPVPQKIFCYCGTGILPVIVEEQARCLCHKKFLLLWKNRQDACVTKNFLLLWNGHLARSIFFGKLKTKKL
ncbi:hypothetical protein QUA07_22670 [Microcoleus sp. T3_A4]|uniref:hypothetical protein n=1 Tax=Microcoleus sp. T3_A4 TaxID=2818968 RepID=UPI002FCE82E3